MKFLYLLLFIPLFVNCQEFKTEPYDEEEKKLRSANPASKLTKIILRKDWEKRDSLTYLRFENLEQIFLVDVDSIPNWIVKFPKLKQINSVSDSKIKTIPENIGELTELEVIYISKSFIKSIPKSIARLKNLEGLILKESQISEIPKEIEDLKNLERLSLGNNAISEVPEEVCKLTKLKSFYINKNVINSLPDCLGELKELETLGIYKNPISELPESIFSLPKLIDIIIEDTPLEENEIIKGKIRELKKRNIDKKRKELEQKFKK